MSALLKKIITCLLYTSDAADERSSVDLGGRRIIKKKNKEQSWQIIINQIIYVYVNTNIKVNKKTLKKGKSNQWNDW